MLETIEENKTKCWTPLISRSRTCKAVSRSEGEQSPEKVLIYAPSFVPTSALLPASISIITDGLKPKIPISPAIVEPVEQDKYSFSGSSDNPPYENPVKRTYLNKLLIIVTCMKWLMAEDIHSLY